MSAGNPEDAIHRGLKPYDIQLGVRFKPFKGVRDIYQVPRGQKLVEIPEDYTYKLTLRKPIMLYGIRGFIDVITDNPFAMFAVMPHNPIEMPLGQTYFESIYKGPNNQEFLQEPRILRVSFYPRGPKDYVNLLNTYADVKIGKEDYVLAWNYSRPRARRILQLLQEGERGWLVEKNLFHAIPKDAIGGIGDIENEEVPSAEDLGRITCVWLPSQLKKLRIPEFVFYRIDHGDDQSADSIRPTPEKELVPALT